MIYIDTQPSLALSERRARPSDVPIIITQLPHDGKTLSLFDLLTKFGIEHVIGKVTTIVVTLKYSDARQSAGTDPK